SPPERTARSRAPAPPRARQQKRSTTTSKKPLSRAQHASLPVDPATVSRHADAVKAPPLPRAPVRTEDRARSSGPCRDARGGGCGTPAPAIPRPCGLKLIAPAPLAQSTPMARSRRTTEAPPTPALLTVPRTQFEG